MSEPIWNRFLTAQDKAVFEASGYGARGGFGKRPALLIVDVNWAFCGDRSRFSNRSSDGALPAAKTHGRRCRTSGR